MHDTINPTIRSFFLGIAILLSLGFGYMGAHAQEAAEQKATFYVY